MQSVQLHSPRLLWHELVTCGKPYRIHLFSQGFLGKWDVIQCLKHWKNGKCLGSQIWRSGFHAVTRSCRRAWLQRLFLQCLHFHLYFDHFGPKYACFTTKGITLRKEHGLQLLRRKGDVWWWKRTPVLVFVVQWCHLGWVGRDPSTALGHQCPSCTDENALNTAGGEYGECKHWWQHVKQLESLAGAQLIWGPVYCLHEKHFPNKTWKSGILEDLHSLGRDNGAFFEM